MLINAGTESAVVDVQVIISYDTCPLSLMLPVPSTGTGKKSKISSGVSHRRIFYDWAVHINSVDFVNLPI
jgi:hypothetical protein